MSSTSTSLVLGGSPQLGRVDDLLDYLAERFAHAYGGLCGGLDEERVHAFGELFAFCVGYLAGEFLRARRKALVEQPYHTRGEYEHDV